MTAIIGYETQLSMAKTQMLGKYGELHAAALLRSVGYEVTDTSRESKQGDLRVVNPGTGEVWRVEVKTSRRVRTGCHSQGWQFCLSKRGHTDYRNADFVMLLAVRGSGAVVCFLIPTYVLGRTAKIIINAKSPLEYRGKWSAWRMPVNSLTLSTECRLIDTTSIDNQVV